METLEPLVGPPELLLVDDMEHRDLLVLYLRRSGLDRTAGYRTAREAVAQMRVHPAKMVIMDVQLAADDDYPNGCVAGLDVVRTWPGTRLLFISGYYRGDEALTECPKGAPMLEKPFGPAALVHRVKDVLVWSPWMPPKEGGTSP